MPYPHIETSADQVPRIHGTATKVVEIALDHLAHHWDAEEIQRQHPHLTLAQIYAALTYYYDHQSELDEDIRRRLDCVKQIERDVGQSMLRAKLQRRDEAV